MRKIFLLFLLLCGMQTSMAQKDSRAREIIEATRNAFEKSKGIRTQFTAEHIVNGTSQGTVSGEMIIAGEMFQIQTEQTTTWFDGKNQWTYLHDNNEVNVSTPTPSELQSMNPYAFLNIYKQGFNYTVSNGTLRNNPVYTIRLTAESKDNDLQEILLDVTQRYYTPYCIRLRQKDNSWTKIVVRSFKDKQKFDKKDFTFPEKKFPGAEIIDLR